MSTVKPLQTSTSGEVCIANISTGERRKRLTFGIVIFAIAIAILAVLMTTGVARLWRLPLVRHRAGAEQGSRPRKGRRG